MKISVVAAVAALCVASPAFALGNIINPAQPIAPVGSAPAVVGTATLFDQVDMPDMGSTPTSLTFTAGADTSVISFAGYNVPSWIDLTNVGIYLEGSTTNLLGIPDFTPAPAGSDAFYNGGLRFGGTSAGNYDVFSQAIATTAGSNYFVNFDLSNSTGGFTSNGLRITASNAAMSGAVPEPATWAMMLLGFGGIGLSMRRRKSTMALQAA